MNYAKIKALATELRRSPTPLEEILWQYLRRKQLEGRKFLRQHPIIYQRSGNDFKFYIPDFYCAKEKLIIELDGKIHEYTKEHDAFRDSILKHLGLTVLRFKNAELKDIKSVLDSIKENFRRDI